VFGPVAIIGFGKEAQKHGLNIGVRFDHDRLRERSTCPFAVLSAGALTIESPASPNRPGAALT